MKLLKTRSDDGTKIQFARWNDEGEKDLLIVHGLAEHVGRYKHVADFFSRQFSVFGGVKSIFSWGKQTESSNFPLLSHPSQTRNKLRTFKRKKTAFSTSHEKT